MRKRIIILRLYYFLSGKTILNLMVLNIYARKFSISVIVSVQEMWIQDPGVTELPEVVDICMNVQP